MKRLIKRITPSFLLGWYHWALAFLGAVLYRFPSRNLKVIGVTGTNGKTTVVSMIAEIFEEAGLKTASLSGIEFKIGEKRWPNKLKMTMPGRMKIQRFFRQAVNANCKVAVLEVTSEGIKQHRHRFINFDAAVFTNLSQEHIEAHKGFENYRKEKAKLFRAAKNIHVINLDDKNADYFWQIPTKKKIGYRLADYPDLQLKLPGEFNKYNAIAAISVCAAYGISPEICKKAVEKMEGVPGRMELVLKEPFRVVVDYAFTPNALEKVYQTLKPANAKMICVLGACGGGRDKWKRPVLGKIADQYCDEIIVTNEDPYNEDPAAIINQVAEGTGDRAQKISDRREAIKRSLEIASQGDTVVITGKGCEPWIVEANGKKVPWDDREVVKEEYEKIRNLRT